MGIRWRTRCSVRLCSGLMSQGAESLEAGFRKFWFRQDWRRYQRSHRIQRHLPRLAGNTVYLTIHLGNLLSVFMVSTTTRSLKASGDPKSSIVHFGTRLISAKCLIQIKVQLSTCQLQIWGKGEHDHSKDISKTIPVAAAKKIKETVGQRASKLHKEHTSVTHHIVSVLRCALCSI